LLVVLAWQSPLRGSEKQNWGWAAIHPQAGSRLLVLPVLLVLLVLLVLFVILVILALLLILFIRALRLVQLSCLF